MAQAPGAAPLLIACALGIERLALRSGDHSGAPGTVTVLRTGMGPQAAGRAITRALRDDDPATRDAAVIATGFCAGLRPGMHPGDLVVADETRDPGGRTACTGTDVLATALARLQRGDRRIGRDQPIRTTTIHTGPLTGSDHVVRGGERAALRATGAVAVDMESAVTLRTAMEIPLNGARRTARPRPVAAVRVVVDAPEHELVRIGTLCGGISAFRVLRAVLPAFFEWHRSLLLPRR
jgi:hypothetical protein